MSHGALPGPGGQCRRGLVARFLLVFGSRPAIRQSLSGLLVSGLLVRESWSAAAT
jgi:hypothetical protein